ncbi:hypothetical protein OG579_16985 [Williamsia herbipolensis]|uniref:Uncharacterized protein n=1 Tax=Williamsia herbipolensis TaxID=1603258 RepID=A0AAU4JZW6_9NOCA|nr:hypothetical protein [Williamsia herbipolensis]
MIGHKEPDYEAITQDREERRRPTIEQIEDRYERRVYGDDRRYR